MANDQDFTEQAEQRLDDLDSRIEEVRSNPDVQEVMGKTSDEGAAERSEDDDKEFHESGEDGKEQDDQTIAPPG